MSILKRKLTNEFLFRYVLPFISFLIFLEIIKDWDHFKKGVMIGLGAY